MYETLGCKYPTIPLSIPIRFSGCVHLVGVLFSISFALWGVFIYITLQNVSNNYQAQINVLNPKPIINTLSCSGQDIMTLVLAVTCLEFIGIIFGTCSMCSGFLDALIETFSQTQNISMEYSDYDEGYAVLRESWIQSPEMVERDLPFDLPDFNNSYLQSSVDRMNNNNNIRTSEDHTESTAVSYHKNNQSLHEEQNQIGKTSIVNTPIHTYSDAKQYHIPTRQHSQRYIQQHHEHYEPSYSCCSPKTFCKESVCSYSFFKLMTALLKSLNGLAIFIIVVIVAYNLFDFGCVNEFPALYELVEPFIICQLVHICVAFSCCSILQCGPFLSNACVILLSR